MKTKLFFAILLVFSMKAGSVFAQSNGIVLDDGGSGPYKAIMTEVAGFAEHTVFAPQDLSKFNAKNPLPVLVWGNGGCANSPRGHEKFLNEIASYGYIVLATGTMPKEGAPRGMGGMGGNQSRAEQQVESMDWAFAQNARPACHIYHDLQQRFVKLRWRLYDGWHAKCAKGKIAGHSLSNHLHPWW